MKALWIPFSLIASLGAQEVKMSAWQNRHILAVLEIADVSDGVDATEARALAEAYFLKFYGLCGGIVSMRLEGRWWNFETVVGPSGSEGQPIRIHSETGWVSKKGPSEIIRPPWDSLRTSFAEYAKSRKDDDVVANDGVDKAPKNTEQGGADQPATASESEPKGNEKPQPEAEERSR